MTVNTRISVGDFTQEHLDIILECYGMTGLPIIEELSLNVEQIRQEFDQKGRFIAILHPTEAERNYLVFSSGTDNDDGIVYLHLGLVPTDYKGDKKHLERIFQKEIIRHFLN